jgi:hypothetical protein
LSCLVKLFNHFHFRRVSRKRHYSFSMARFISGWFVFVGRLYCGRFRLDNKPQKPNTLQEGYQFSLAGDEKQPSVLYDNANSL